MKTAMEKKETGLMRQIGYLSFVVVLLYGLTLFAVSCDNDEDPPLPPAVEKVVLAFGVDQGEGQLSAKPELENTAAEKIGELISPAEIAKGTTVHFRATHSKSWTIMYSLFCCSFALFQDFALLVEEHFAVRAFCIGKCHLVGLCAFLAFLNCGFLDCQVCEILLDRVLNRLRQILYLDWLIIVHHYHNLNIRYHVAGECH